MCRSWFKKLEFTEILVKGRPYYHFAFNIQSNMFNEAKSWVKENVSLKLEDGEDEADFSHLLAHSLYFYDPSGNVVEFISRQSISETGEDSFSAKSILNISGINPTVPNAIEVGQHGVFKQDNNFMNGQGLFDFRSNSIFQTFKECMTIF